MKYLLVLLVLYTSTAMSEIEKIVIPDERCGGMCFYWWPKLAVVDGWHQDEEYSLHYHANTQAPVGQTFKSAEVVIYARALYKPRVPEFATLQDLIQMDHDEFSRHSRTIISKVDPAIDGDGNLLVSYTFFPKSTGNYERVSYGEEGEFYLIFTISSRTESGYVSTLPTYLEFLKSYREKTKK